MISIPHFQGILNAGDPYPWPNDNFDSYTDGAELNALSRGSQWAIAWIDRRNPFGNTDINDSFESYTDGVGIYGMSGGTSWNTNWVSSLTDPAINSSADTPPSTITITTADVGVPLYYTLDGSTPTTGSTLYTASFSLSSETTIKTIAVATPRSSSIVSRIVLAALATGSVALWEATSLSLNDGDAVSTWTDGSGQGRDATQSSATLKPLYKTNIFGTKPALLFDGSNDLLNFSASGVPNFTVFQVYKPAAANYSVATITWCAATGNRSGFALNGTDRHITTFNSAGSETNNKIMGSPALIGNTKHVICWTYNGTTLVARDNGATLSNSSVDGGFGNTNGIGWSYNYFNGYLAALVVYDRVLGSTEISSSEQYLNNKYPCY